MIRKFLGKNREPIYALLRIVSGILFISHGIQKITGFANETLPSNDILLVMAAVIETIGGFMIIIGWLTDWAAFIASGEMAVAYFKAHAPNGFLPINNGGELAVLYCFLFLFIASYGSGIWSVDNAGKKKIVL
jgi:putative oxidoreductase